jgi:hypothetical protein
MVGQPDRVPFIRKVPLRTSILPLLLVAGLLSGCGTSAARFLPLDFSGSQAGNPAVGPGAVAAVAQPEDPLAIFAASARPGQPGTVQGQPARLVRVYNAASGRECREVLLGSGATERTAVACRTPEGSFVAARPLLRGSAR